MRHPPKQANTPGGKFWKGTAAWIVSMLAIGAALNSAGAPAAGERCAGAPNEVALLACRQKHADDISSQLTTALEKLRKRYQSDEPERWKMLIAAQDAWQTYQRAECRFRTQESAAGSAHEIYRLTCLADLGVRRHLDLKWILNNP